MAEAIISRWDGLSGRLPDRLEDLRGPREGVVVLPVHLTWHGLREFDVAKDESRLVLYSILLGQGRRERPGAVRQRAAARRGLAGAGRPAQPAHPPGLRAPARPARDRRAGPA